MRSVLGYVVVTALVALGGLCTLLYIREGDRASPLVWSGGEIRVGYTSEPPYAFRRKDGEISGEAPEIAKAVLSSAQIGPIRWVLLDFNQAIPALLDGRIDMIANGLFITPERAALVLFSLPYSRSWPALLVARGNPLGLHSYNDAASNEDATVAVLDGSVEQLALRRLGKPASHLFVVPDPAAGLLAVRSGRADCLALTSPSVDWLAKVSSGETEPARPFHIPPDALAGQSAFAFRPGDHALAERINAALKNYIGTPQHRSRMMPLGFDATSLPDWSH